MMSKHKKNSAREREIRRRRQQAMSASSEKSATIPVKTVDALPEGAKLIESHREWSHYTAGPSATPYVVVKRPDGSEQVYEGRSAYSFMNLAAGMTWQLAHDAALQRVRAEEKRGSKLYFEALREKWIPLAMDEPLRVGVLDPRLKIVVPIYEALPSELALMMVNCLDGRQTNVFMLDSPPLTFNKQLEPDGTVVVRSADGNVCDLYIAPGATEADLERLRKRGETAQEEME